MIAVLPTISNVDLVSVGIKLSRSENLPVMPQVVSAVLRVVDDPKGSPKTLERLLERDASLSGKILKVANSSYYGHTQVPTVARAISVLGINTVRSLVTAVGFHQMSGDKSTCKCFDKVAYWKHCLATATAARILGKLRLPLKAEELFSAGMLHEIGFVAMEKLLPTELDLALKRARELGVDVAAIEQEILGFDHTDVGALLAEKWGLSKVILSAIRYANDPFACEDMQEICLLINAASTLADQCGFAMSPLRGEINLDPMVAAVLDMPEDQLDVIRSVLAQEVERAQSAFSMSPAA